MHMVAMKNIANSSMYIVQESQTFLKKHSMRSHLQFHYEAFYFHQYSQYILLQLIYQLICFYTYNFYNVNVLQHHMSYYIQAHSCWDSKKNSLSHITLSINSLHSHLHLSSFHLCLLSQTLASNLHLHLHVLYHSICLVSLVLDIRLNALTFMLTFMLGTHNLAYGS